MTDVERAKAALEALEAEVKRIEAQQKKNQESAEPSAIDSLKSAMAKQFFNPYKRYGL